MSLTAANRVSPSALAIKRSTNALPFPVIGLRSSSSKKTLVIFEIFTSSLHSFPCPSACAMITRVALSVKSLDNISLAFSSGSYPHARAHASSDNALECGLARRARRARARATHEAREGAADVFIARREMTLASRVSSVTRAQSRGKSERARGAATRASASTVTRRRSVGTSEDDDFESFRNISEKDVAFIVFERDDVREALSKTNLREYFRTAESFERKARVDADVGGLEVRRALFADATSSEAALDVLCDDIARVVRGFARAVPMDKDERVLVNLSLLRSTLCSRLHVDHTSARCMVTYFGAGTEVLDERTSGIIAKANASGGNVVSDALKSLAERFAPPRAVRECAVCLLKGERWTYVDGSTSKGQAIVHRSPAIDADNGEWRLTLKLDVESFGCACGHAHDDLI